MSSSLKTVYNGSQASYAELAQALRGSLLPDSALTLHYTRADGTELAIPVGSIIEIVEGKILSLDTDFCKPVNTQQFRHKPDLSGSDQSTQAALPSLQPSTVSRETLSLGSILEVSPEGGKKHDSGKLDYSLLPPESEAEIIAVLSAGAATYGPHNWRAGLSYSRVLSAARRHIAAFQRGERFSEHCFNGKPNHHIANAIVELIFLLQFDLEERFELNDLYKRKP